ncbi:unnamed protein product, partial [Ectocarpus sp. 12 AP-2014]
AAAAGTEAEGGDEAGFISLTPTSPAPASLPLLLCPRESWRWEEEEEVAAERLGVGFLPASFSSAIPACSSLSPSCTVGTASPSTSALESAFLRASPSFSPSSAWSTVTFLTT